MAIVFRGGGGDAFYFENTSVKKTLYKSRNTRPNLMTSSTNMLKINILSYFTLFIILRPAVCTCCHGNHKYNYLIATVFR